MYLISSNPTNFDDVFEKTVQYAAGPGEALTRAKQHAAKYGRGYIFKLEKFLVATDEVPTQAYSMNDKGEVLPCD